MAEAIGITQPQGSDESKPPTEESLIQFAKLEPPESIAEAPLEVRREHTAAWLAYGLLILFALTVLPPLIVQLFGVTPPPEVFTYVKDIATIETTLLGVTFGFYFSQRRLSGDI